MGKIIAIGTSSILLIISLLLLDKLHLIWINEIKSETPLITNPLPELGIQQRLPISPTQFVAVINHTIYPVKGLAIIDEQDRFISWLPQGEITPLGIGEWNSMGDVLDWWRFGYLDEDDKTEELAVQFGIAGTALVHPFYLYTYDERKGFKLLLKLTDASSQTYIADLDSDGNKEIIHDYSISGIGKLERDLLRWKDIWKLEKRGVRKVNNQYPQMYQSLKEIHTLGLTKKEWAPDVSWYYPILRCLKKKAELTISGTLTEIDGCRKLLNQKYQ